MAEKRTVTGSFTGYLPQEQIAEFLDEDTGETLLVFIDTRPEPARKNIKNLIGYRCHADVEPREKTAPNRPEQAVTGFRMTGEAARPEWRQEGYTLAAEGYALFQSDGIGLLPARIRIQRDPAQEGRWWQYEAFAAHPIARGTELKLGSGHEETLQEAVAQSEKILNLGGARIQELVQEREKVIEGSIEEIRRHLFREKKA